MRSTPMPASACPMPPPAEEARRLAVLQELAALDMPREAAFDDIAALAALICETPMAVVSLVDAERQWFMGRHGVEMTETPRHIAFCAHTILGDGLLQVTDATLDPRFARNPLVTGEPRLRFYAGAPLIAESGERYGTVCAFDTRPRRLGAHQRDALTRLAGHAARQFRERGERLWSQARDVALGHLLDALPDGVAACGRDGRL